MRIRVAESLSTEPPFSVSHLPDLAALDVSSLFMFFHRELLLLSGKIVLNLVWIKHRIEP